MHNLWRIVKDALQAFAFWLVASLLAVYFLGYAGHVVSLGLGFLLVLCFCILRGLDLLVFLGILRRTGVPPASTGGPLGGHSGAPPLGNSGGRPCPNCSGGSISCYACSGGGSRIDSSGQLATCNVCGGRRSLTCNTCSGGGRVYW